MRSRVSIPLVALLPLLAIVLLLVPAGARAKDDPPPPAADAPRAIRALIVDQEANGLPNQPTEDLVRQRLIIGADRLCLEDLGSGVVTILRLDREPPATIELSADRAHYREGRDLDRIQRDRDTQERQILEGLADASAKEREAVMADLHLRPGLAREVAVDRTGEKREILGREAERVIVRENGRVVVDAWIAPEELEVPFFEFYRRVGAFSEAVLAELRGVEGLPLEVDFTVVTATLAHKIQVRARAIRVDDVSPFAFEVPPTAEKVEESPFAQCPICGRDVERASPPAGKSTRRDGTEVFFDSRECKAEYNQREWPEIFGKPKGR